MTPITPQRFIELIENSGTENAVGVKYVDLYTLTGRWRLCSISLHNEKWICHEYGSYEEDTAGSVPLDDLYESKPQTLYDELSEVLDDCGNTSDLYEGVKSWRNKNESELESIITKEV